MYRADRTGFSPPLNGRGLAPRHERFQTAGPRQYRDLDVRRPSGDASGGGRRWGKHHGTVRPHPIWAAGDQWGRRRTGRDTSGM